MFESSPYELTYSYPKLSEGTHIVHSSFFLGVFSSLEKVEKAIDFYTGITGFSNNPDRFFIRPIGTKICSVVFQVSIAYIAKNEIDDVDEIIGYYETEKAAKEAAKSCHLYHRFNKYFVIDSITVDKMEWTEGFV